MEEEEAAGGRQKLLPAWNRGLFLLALITTGGLAAALVLGNALVVQPLAAAVLVDAEGIISRADPAGAAYRDLVRGMQADVRRLLLAAVVAGSAVKVATIFAAVAAFSSSSSSSADTTAGAAMDNAKGDAVLTVAFGHAFEAACAGAVVALTLLAVAFLDYSLLLVFLDALLVLLASLFLAYLTVVCCAAAVAVVSAAAVSRAWRFTRGNGARAALSVVAACALGALASPVYTLAVRRSAAAAVAAVVAYVLLLAAAEVFSVAAVTACYLECTEEEEEEEETMAGHRYIKLPSGDQLSNI